MTVLTHEQRVDSNVDLIFSIKQKLKEVRIARGLTPVEVDGQAGFPIGTTRDAEVLDQDVSLHTIMRLLTIYELSLDLTLSPKHLVVLNKSDVIMEDNVITLPLDIVTQFDDVEDELLVKTSL